MMLKTRRICAGEYEVFDTLNFRPDHKVRVTQVKYPDEGTYWIAAAAWDSCLYTDPVLTKRDAVHNAHEMLRTRYNQL